MIYYKKKIQQDVGATAVEYGILSALIAVVTILGLQATGTNLGTTYCTIANQLSQAVGAGATASGCSATSSSSSSSSSSADSSGSSADSSSSDSSGSSDSSSDSSSSSSTQAEYNASNSYTPVVGDRYSNLSLMLGQHTQSLTGVYDANGNAITTPEQYAEAIGISDDTYQKLENYYNGNLSNSDFNTADADAQSETDNNPSANVYIPDLSQLTFTTYQGYQNYTYKYSAMVGNSTTDYNFHPTDTSFRTSITQFMNAPTGNGN